jgi:predicted sugar kinase
LAGLAPLPREAAAEICHEVLMRVLPGAAGNEFEHFATGLTRIQRILGEHFAAAQHGRTYTSAKVGRLMEWIDDHARAGIGQSSWGPTGFAVLSSEDEAQTVLATARAAGVVDDGLLLQIVRPRNRGAEVNATRLPRHPPGGRGLG